LSIEALPQFQTVEEVEQFQGRFDLDKDCDKVIFGGTAAYDCIPIASFMGERYIVFSKDVLPFLIIDAIQDNTSNQILSTFQFIDTEESKSIILLRPVIEYSIPGNKLTEPIISSYTEEQIKVDEEFIIDDVDFGFLYDGAGDLKFKLIDVEASKVTLDIIAEQWPVDREFHSKEPPERVVISTETCITPFPLIVDVFYQYCFEVERGDSDVELKYQIKSESTLPSP